MRTRRSVRRAPPSLPPPWSPLLVWIDVDPLVQLRVAHERDVLVIGRPRGPQLGARRVREASRLRATALTATGAWYPRYAPDGASIAFLRADGVYVMNADGTGQTSS